MWPESDVDMMNATLDTVLADEHFMTYYLTVSGHLEYNFFGNAMAMRNEEAVAELDLPEAPVPTLPAISSWIKPSACCCKSLKKPAMIRIPSSCWRPTTTPTVWIPNP